jgi:repressor LexA
MATATREIILAFLQSYIEENGYAPSLREIARACGVKSASVVQYHLDSLEHNNLIKRAKDKPRSISLKVTGERLGIPILGTISAGLPLPVPDADTWSTAREWIDVPFSISRGRKDVYGLHVRGLSMIDALIDDRDIVIMQHTTDVKNGQVAACWLKNRQETTLKQIYFEGQKIRLQPCNPYMTPFYEPAENVQVQGKLMHVIRSFR